MIRSIIFCSPTVRPFPVVTQSFAEKRRYYKYIQFNNMKTCLLPLTFTTRIFLFSTQQLTIHQCTTMLTITIVISAYKFFVHIHFELKSWFRFFNSFLPFSCSRVTPCDQVALPRHDRQVRRHLV